MTIPIRPGPWSFLAGAGEATGKIAAEIQARKLRERQEAMQGLMTLAQMAQMGFAAPESFADPAVAAQATRAGVPVPAGGFAPTPSAALVRDRRVNEMVADPNANPAAVAGALNLPTPGQLGADALTAIQADLQKGILSEASLPALRQLFKIPSNEVAGKVETAQLTQAEMADEAEIQTIANQLVLGFNGDIGKAKAELAKDPRVPKERVNERHWLAAQHQWDDWWEKAQEKYLGQARERRLANASEQEQLSRMLIANQQLLATTATEFSKIAPTLTTTLIANAKQVDAEGKPTPLAVSAREQIARYQMLQQTVDELRADNRRLQGVYQTKYGAAPGQAGAVTGVVSGSSSTAAASPKGPTRKAGESDALFWERAKAAGLSSEEATNWVKNH